MAYGYAFAVIVPPGIFFHIGTSVSARDRNALGCSAPISALIGFFVLWLVAVTVTGTSPDRLTLGALIDPFGIGAFEVATRYWTAADRNTRLPEVAGYPCS